MNSTTLPKTGLRNMLALSIRPRTERTVAVLPAVDGKVSVLPLPKYPADPSARQFDDIDDARAFGYPPAPEDAVLAAFRLRFRPHATGPMSDTDRVMIADLAARFPVDARAARA